MPSGNDRVPIQKGQTSDLSDFLDRLARTPVTKAAGVRGRLIFAMDATASREPTWDRACHVQAEMFSETDSLGGLEVQLVFYRGFGQCKASPWVASSAELVRRMVGVHCLGGQTQIAKVLRHAIKETRKKKVNALVFVGDCMEEDVDELCHAAGELGVLGVPVFMFHEGNDGVATRAFRQIARLSGGAYCRFDSSSAAALRDLLSAVAVYAAGGRMALADYGKKAGESVRLLTSQINR